MTGGGNILLNDLLSMLRVTAGISLILAWPGPSHPVQITNMIDITRKYFDICYTLWCVSAFIDPDQALRTYVNILCLSNLIIRYVEFLNFVKRGLFFNNSKLYFCLPAYVSGMICD